MPEENIAAFTLEIAFEKDSDVPSRVFRAMSELIEACQSLDQTLAESISTRIETTLLLEDVQAGSIRSLLRSIITSVDDEALKQLEWKSLVGGYLVKGKYFVLKFLEEKTTIDNRAELGQLEAGLQTLATETDVRQLPSYKPVSMTKLLHNLEAIESGLSHLAAKDEASFATTASVVAFNKEFHLGPGAIEKLLTREKIRNTVETILKVKKPDYLGESMWEVLYDGKGVEAKIADCVWLLDFQNRRFDVRPGDSLRTTMEIEAHYGFDNEILSIHYRVIKVHEVVIAQTHEQGLLLPSDEGQALQIRHNH